MILVIFLYYIITKIAMKHIKHIIRLKRPNLDINVEPTEHNNLVYLPLASRTSMEKAYGQISLRLSIKNNEDKDITVNKLVISSNNIVNKTIPMNMKINSNKTKIWSHSREYNMIFPLPAPKDVNLSLWCNGFNIPAIMNIKLRAHKSPNIKNSYLFPAKARDLRIGEYWSGTGANHNGGKDGSQLFAYDLGVIRWNGSKWAKLLDGGSGKNNEDFLVWGKPIYAMADGNIIKFIDGVESNKVGKVGKGGGNLFFIQHGSEQILYAHFQKGTLNPKLMKKGAKVKAGEYLALAGNSGRSTGPHLHIHAFKNDDILRPLPFHSMYTINRDKLDPPDPKGAWVKVNRKGLPAYKIDGLSNVKVAIWPAATKPSWYPPEWGEISKHGIPSNKYQKEFNKLTSSGYRLEWIDGYDVNGRAFFNVIFRYNNGVRWVARHGLNGRQYQDIFDKYTKQGYRLVHIESYLDKGIRYAPIFVRDKGPSFVAYHHYSANEHQEEFEKLSSKGWVPINVSVVSTRGNRYYTALYEKKKVGSFYLKSFMTPSDYQKEFNINKASGRTLVYLNAYTHDNSPRLIAIWHKNVSYNSLVAKHGLTSNQYQEKFDTYLSKGFLTQAVTGYEQNNSHRFAAYWTK